MYRYTLILVGFALVSCSSSPTLTSPVSLENAIRTLPSDAVGDVSDNGREEFIQKMPAHEGINISERRLHYFSDGGDHEPVTDRVNISRLCLFEDEYGRTIAAGHTSRSFGSGSEPNASNTFVYRLDKGKWNDITSSALPAEIRSWWFHFNETPIPCGPYVKFQRRDGRGEAYKFGEQAGTLFWKDGAFQFKAN